MHDARLRVTQLNRFLRLNNETHFFEISNIA